MDAEEIKEFAKLLVNNVRDSAIKSLDSQLHTNNMNSPTAKRWRTLKNEGKIEKLAETIIADSVDDTIFFLLHAIDNGIIKMSFNPSNGNPIDLTTNGKGELSGWYIGEWCKRLSKERFNDYVTGTFD